MTQDGVALSVVVVPLAGGEVLENLLRILQDPEMLPLDAEIVVVGSKTPAGSDARIHHSTSPPESSVPQRRALGASRTRGRVIALLEDTVLPDRGWGDAILALHRDRSDAAAIGGTIRIPSDLLPRECALLLLEYGRFVASTAVSEAARSLPGSNLSFKRASLDRVGALSGAAIREAEILSRLALDPGAVRLESRMSATCVAADPRGLGPASRFHHGRLHAGMRLEPRQRLERYARALTAPLLALVILLRGARSLARVRPSQPVMVLAHLAWMSAAWSAGEAVGYLFGAGRAEEHWT